MNRAVRRWAVVPAAGSGERFGGRVPKQYASLSGQPVLSWSLQALLSDPGFERVMVAIAPGDPRWTGLAESRDPRVLSCAGGCSRAQSVALALAALEPLASHADWVLVHDAARPCLSRNDLLALVRGVGDDSVGGLLAIPVSDTLKREDGEGRSVGTVPREALWRALTPQMFRYGLLRRALLFCQGRRLTVTDEASAIEALGLRPMLVRGRADNIKVTDPQDSRLAVAILESGELDH